MNLCHPVLLDCGAKVRSCNVTKRWKSKFHNYCTGAVAVDHFHTKFSINLKKKKMHIPLFLHTKKKKKCVHEPPVIPAVLSVHIGTFRLLYEQTSAYTYCEVHSQMLLEKWVLTVLYVCNNVSTHNSSPLGVIIAHPPQRLWTHLAYKFNNHPPFKETGLFQGWKIAHRENRLVIFALCHGFRKSASSSPGDCTQKVQSSVLFEIIFRPHCEYWKGIFKCFFI